MSDYQNGHFLPRIATVASLVIATTTGLLLGLICCRPAIARAGQAQLRAEALRLQNKYAAERREAELRADHARRASLSQQHRNHSE
jgi:hypothetical protein